MRMIAVAAITTALASPAMAETYRLIHATGNEERQVAKDLSKPECEKRKRELTSTAEALGIHSERLGRGSITCLPESIFED